MAHVLVEYLRSIKLQLFSIILKNSPNLLMSIFENKKYRRLIIASLRKRDFGSSIIVFETELYPIRKCEISVVSFRPPESSI